MDINPILKPFLDSPLIFIATIILALAPLTVLYYMANRSSPSATLPRARNAAIVPPIPTSRVPRPNPNYEWSILGRININAPPAACFAAIRDYAAWGEWNNWIPRIEIVARDGPASTKDASGKELLGHGMRFKVTVFMAGDGMAKLRAGKWGLSDVVRVVRCGPLEDGRKGYTISWTNVSAFNVSERIHEFVESDDGKTEYTQWDTFGGPMYYGWLIYGLFGKHMMNRISDGMDEFKVYVEARKTSP